MAQKRGSDKRRASESSGSSADAKKQKLSPMKSASTTSSARSPGKKRPSPLKSSFKKSLQSAKRVSPPVTFNQSVKYDDGSQSDMCRSPITPPPSYEDSMGRKVKVSRSDSTQDEDMMAKGGTVQASDRHIPKRGNNTSRFANLTSPPTPRTPKKNPLFFPPETSKTAFPETSTTATQETKTVISDRDPKHAAKYDPCSPLLKHDRSASGLKVLEELVREHRALTLEEASDALIAVRDQVRAFSTKHFEYEMTLEEKHDWPLADLQDKHAELVANCAYIADGSQYGWRQLFTESYCRPQLVNGLLAHYIVEHVFKHTCFGLNEKELADLEDNVLKKYIHYDGFVRTKQLALGITAILNVKGIEDRSFDTFVAVTNLSTRILSTIEPLSRNCSKAKAEAEAEADLNQILSHAQALALALRLTGTNRTIFRFNFPTKHSEYQLGGVQNCLNIARVDATQHHAPDHDRDELRVKIPCWPTITAIVPSGPDMLDFKNDPSLTQRAGKPLPTHTGGAPEDNPGAFVTEIFMTPADVYCEWTPLAAPLQFPLKLTLWQAIQQAQKECALALGQPWPQPQPQPHPAPRHRTAARTAGFILGAAAAVGGLAAAAAVTACTPSGRRLLLDAAGRLTGYMQRTEDAVQDVIADAADKELFFSRLGKIPLPTRGFSLHKLRSRVSKPRTIIPQDHYARDEKVQ
jgi:hypothetical protein